MIFNVMTCVGMRCCLLAGAGIRDGNTSFIMKVECPAAKNHYILGHD